MKAAFTFDAGWSVEVTLDGDVVHFPEGTFAEGDRMRITGPDAGQLLDADGHAVGTVEGELHLPDGYEVPVAPVAAREPVEPVRRDPVEPMAAGAAPEIPRKVLAMMAAAVVLLVAAGAFMATRRSGDGGGDGGGGGATPVTQTSGPAATFDAAYTITNGEKVSVRGTFTDKKPGTCAAFAHTGPNTSFVPPRVAEDKAEDGSIVTIDLAALGYPGPGRQASLNPFGVGIDFVVTRDSAPVVTPLTEVITVLVNEDGSGRTVVRGRDQKAPGRPVDVLTLTWTCRD